MDTLALPLELMARYRIIEKPSYFTPWQPVYEIQKRFLLWWETATTESTLEGAEQWVQKALENDAKPEVRRKVIQTYD